jgi:1,4-dihydroxy-6-naphthoate synthase
MAARTLRLGHSPDPDDAFMFYGLATNKIDTRGWAFEHVLQDIQTLNDRARRGELEITAISIHAYPYVASNYALTNCGSSMGDGYGPMIVAREQISLDSLRGKTIAVPGLLTTAFLALQLRLGRDSFTPCVMPFDEILQAVAAGQADAGLIIHEGQLTYQNQGLKKIVDLGEWWKAQHKLPLPLGGNAIRRDLGAAAMVEIAAILKQSIVFSLEHRKEAVAHALQYARDMGHDLADRFVGMYVNEWTIDYGDAGRQAVELLLQKGAAAGLVPPIEKIDFIG